MVDARDLKSLEGYLVRVRVPPRAPKSMKKYFVTIGLEVHAELNTKSKMWCGCANIPLESKANINVCPICMAHPGTLPVANVEALKKMVSIGLAVRTDVEKENGTYKNVSNFIEFDRKNYFYPDMPKAYQITQYQYPVVNGGALKVNVDGSEHVISLTRIHLEEDTAKSTHDKGDYTLIDFNRAGVPLMELVTDAHTYEDVQTAARVSSEFGRELRRTLRTLDASDADMEKGQMRVEANISVTTNPDIYGTKCEVKNLNSFKSVEDAIKYEVERHIDLIESGGQVVQETRGWDEQKRVTFAQRKKENAHDYRYFPDPDLPKLYTYELFDIPHIMSQMPSIPEERRRKWVEIGLQDKQISQLLDDIALGDYYLSVINDLPHNADKIAVANYLLTDIVGIASKIKTDFHDILPAKSQTVELIMLLNKNELSSRGAKDLLAFIIINHDACRDKTSKQIAIENNLIQKSDPSALSAIVDTVIAANITQWSEYKGVEGVGNDKLLMYFIGQCMREAKGSGNPTLFKEILVSK